MCVYMLRNLLNSPISGAPRERSSFSGEFLISFLRHESWYVSSAAIKSVRFTFRVSFCLTYFSMVKIPLGSLVSKWAFASSRLNTWHVKSPSLLPIWSKMPRFFTFFFCHEGSCPYSNAYLPIVQFLSLKTFPMPHLNASWS